MYTKLAAVPLAVLQAYGFVRLMTQNQLQILEGISPVRFAAIMVAMTAGTMFLVWVGELITEKKIGNGVSLIIFSGIVSALPKALLNLTVNYNPSDLYTYLLFAAVAIVTVVGVVIISEAQRNIPVQYAKQMRGGRTMSHIQSHLPLRLNMAGVIPIIFAVSIIVFPSVLAQFFVNHAGTIGNLARKTIALFSNQLFYGITYFLLVFGFTYFYTAIIFQPKKIAENLQRQGGFIPGIRPGTQTEQYLAKIMTRLVFGGAIFLGIIAVLPTVIQAITGSRSFVIGGTSLLIVVSVAIETAKQIQSQLTMHEYDHV
jgi:preprotein translocase subunit SecY